MKLSTRFGLLVLLGVAAVSMTGCSSSKNSQREISVIHAQIAALTDELVRVDEDLQTMRSSMQDLENKSSSAPSTSSFAASSSSAASSGGAVYRTPSGFELPAMSIQRALKNAGYYSGNVDGKIGSQTKAAVKSFQRDNGLTVDGVVGRGTWAKLKAYEMAIK